MKPTQVERANGSPYKVTFTFGNVTMTFKRPTAGKKLLCDKVHTGQVYDQANAFVPYIIYKDMIKVAYGILYDRRVKKVAVPKQLELGI